MKKLIILLACICFSCTSKKSEISEKETISALLNNWHKAASDADFDSYFNAMADESIFIGTDATENWNKKDFMTYSKPHFDKGKAWRFTPLEQNIYLSEDGKTAWFDELLNTQMKICRGSGVLQKINGKWKIKHYVLSMTIPNDNTNEVIKTKAPLEDALIEKLRSKN